MAGQRLSRAAAGRRPLWRWLLVVFLLIFSLGITTVYVATVTTDLRQHHWAGALGASRAAVPAVVAWAALLIVLFARGTTAAEQLPSDEHRISDRRRQAALAEDSVRQAEQRVQRLAATLAELSAVAAQAGQNRQLARQIGDTAARLDQAGQWLIGARAALAASQREVANAGSTQPDSFSKPGPTARRVA